MQGSAVSAQWPVMLNAGLLPLQDTDGCSYQACPVSYLPLSAYSLWQVVSLLGTDWD